MGPKPYPWIATKRTSRLVLIRLLRISSKMVNLDRVRFVTSEEWSLDSENLRRESPEQLHKTCSTDSLFLWFGATSPILCSRNKQSSKYTHSSHVAAIYCPSYKIFDFRSVKDRSAFCCSPCSPSHTYSSDPNFSLGFRWWCWVLYIDTELVHLHFRQPRFESTILPSLFCLHFIAYCIAMAWEPVQFHLINLLKMSLNRLWYRLKCGLAICIYTDPYPFSGKLVDC